MDALIAIEITPQEADCFRKMREAGCFELREGNCTLHFGRNGVLLKIEKKVFTAYQVSKVETDDVIVR